MHIHSPFPSALLSMVLLTGCALRPSAQPTMSTEGTTLVQTAQVTNVRDIAVRGGRPSGIGSFLGAILGGVAGSRFGSGHGSTAAGIGGAVAGGMAGQHAEQSASGRNTMEVTVRFEGGELRTYQVEPDDHIRVGDVVNVTTRGGITRINR